MQFFIQNKVKYCINYVPGMNYSLHQNFSGKMSLNFNNFSILSHQYTLTHNWRQTWLSSIIQRKSLLSTHWPWQCRPLAKSPLLPSSSSSSPSCLCGALGSWLVLIGCGRPKVFESRVSGTQIFSRSRSFFTTAACSVALVKNSISLCIFVSVCLSLLSTPFGL